MDTNKLVFFADCISAVLRAMDLRRSNCKVSGCVLLKECLCTLSPRL